MAMRQTDIFPGRDRLGPTPFSTPGEASLADFLDDVVPLRGASHHDIVHYGVHVPMHYAECYATTRDGRQVQFADKRCFRGFTGHAPLQALLFDTGDTRFELLLESQQPNTGKAAAGAEIIMLSRTTPEARSRHYIGIDGARVEVRTIN